MTEQTAAVDLGARVRQLIADELGHDVAIVQDTHGLAADLQADSLDMLELVMAIEEAFGMDIPDADIHEHFTTVGAVVAYVTTRVSDRT